MIQIDNNHRIRVEENNNHILEFFEQRTKRKKNGQEEEYEYTEIYYYPTIKDCLIKYLHLTQSKSTSVQEVVDRINLAEKNVTELVRNLQKL